MCSGSEKEFYDFVLRNMSTKPAFSLGKASKQVMIMRVIILQHTCRCALNMASRTQKSRVRNEAMAA